MFCHDLGFKPSLCRAWRPQYLADPKGSHYRKRKLRNRQRRAKKPAEGDDVRGNHINVLYGLAWLPLFLAPGLYTWGAERGVANWSGVDPGEVHSWPFCEVPRLLWF